MSTEKPRPRMNIRYLFNYCNDLGAVRRFYSEMLQMQETGFQETPEFGWLVYKSEGFELMFFKIKQPVEVATKWTEQPGYEGGERAGTSWAVEIPESDFAAVFAKAKAMEIRLFKPRPEWRQSSYWGFSAMDPIGTTVEIYTTPKEKPASTEWPD